MENGATIIMIPDDENERIKYKNKILDLLQLPEYKIKENIQDLLTDDDKFKFYFPNIFAFTFAVLHFPKQYIPELVRRLLTDKQFRRLVDDIEDWSLVMREFPDSYAKEIEFYLFTHDEAFDRLFTDIRVFHIAISCVPEIFADRMIAFILNKPQVFDRLIPYIDHLAYVVNSFSSAYVDRFLQKVLNSSELYNRLLYKSELLFHVMMIFPKEIAQQLVQQAGYTLRLSLRTHVVKKHPDCIPVLIHFGIDPYSVDDYMNHLDLLHSISLYQPRMIDQYIPLALALGVHPSPRHAYLQDKEKGKHVIACLITSAEQSEKLSLTTIYTILSLIQYGEGADYRDQNNKNIFQIMYGYHPSIRNTIQSFGVIEKELADSEYVLGRVNISILRLEVQYLSLIHQARNEFINLLTLLAMDNQNLRSSSYFKLLPLEIIFHILRFFDFSTMDKTMKEGISLARCFFSAPKQIKAMLALPGGINVFQQYQDDHNYSFVFFKSARVLYQDFFKLNYQVNKKLHTHRFFITYRKKQDMLSSVCKLREHALIGLKIHLSLYQKPSSKLLLLGEVNHFRLT